MRKKVLLFIPQGTEELELSAFTDVMGWSRIHAKVPIDLITTSFHSEVQCAWNLRVLPELAFEDVDVLDFDALAIPGGFESKGYYQDIYREEFSELIRAFFLAKKPIAAICVAALALGKSGILQGIPSTTYDLEGGRQEQLAAFGGKIQTQRIVVHQNIITSTGPSTALDVAFKLLEILSDKENVALVKKYMRF
ncbi:MAG: DJ-1/PfpI family protein [Flavobacteriales bacterium]|nr:MAG: DJ-1/PfpI family protein [Flavobacteriales bacterium]